MSSIVWITHGKSLVRTPHHLLGPEPSEERIRREEETGPVTAEQIKADILQRLKKVQGPIRHFDFAGHVPPEADPYSFEEAAPPVKKNDGEAEEKTPEPDEKDVSMSDEQPADEKLV